LQGLAAEGSHPLSSYDVDVFAVFGPAEMTDHEMTIREMCDAFDVTPRTLRFYESKELLFPRRDGQKRLFTRRDRARLKLILRGKRFGFSAGGNPPASGPLLRGRQAGHAA
jgi:hypothetical protein